jgi:hypothetical protein
MAQTKLKCYLGNLDGRREGCIVTTSQKEAARIVGTTLTDFRAYWTTPRVCPIDNPKPHTLYTSPFVRGNWVEGLCDVPSRR